MVLPTPLATYRLQFHGAFRLDDARRVIPYLQALGVTDLYASPLFKARRGSTHGYDVVDVQRLNPEIGTEEGFADLARERERFGMGLLLDIVPNHMAASSENPWWMDVLENGPSSPYASFFDITWASKTRTLRNKVLLPVLGAHYGKVLEGQELLLTLGEEGLFIRYYDKKFPLELRSYGVVLEHALAHAAKEAKETPSIRGLGEVLTEVLALPLYTTAEPGAMEIRGKGSRAIKEKLWQLYSREPDIKALIDTTLSAINGNKGEAESFQRLDGLLNQQVYRLAYWRSAGEQINYRRFFDITDLVGMRVEESQVFQASHALLSRWVAEGMVTGVRIDHIDGLYDPLGYLKRLQKELQGDGGSGGHFYVVVEKILAREETLPKEWPVAGTTGYEFIDTMNGLFLSPAGLKKLSEVYAQFSGEGASWREVRNARKRQMLGELFQGEMDSLARCLADLADDDRWGRDVSHHALSRALTEVTASLPVYRTYVQGPEVPIKDRFLLKQTLTEARQGSPDIPGDAFDFLERVLLLAFPDTLSPEERKQWLRFVTRWQQLTGPVMAKGFEDTTLYVYNRLISLNDVGCDPDPADLSVGYFHQWNQRRLSSHRAGLNATSTHDTKRSEDVRARVHVLSELAAEWSKRLGRWQKLNQKKKKKVQGQWVPDANEEYLIYQTLLGAWPLVRKEFANFKTRIKAYLVKAMREAKVHSSWLEPDESYERALLGFVDALFRKAAKDKFLTDFVKFQSKTARYGAVNSLAQVLLKIVSPGVPDFYQGTDLWDLSLVDPDNRRPVDFQERARALEELKKGEAEDENALLQKLLTRWQDGRIKLYVISKALNFRKSHPEMFLKGSYLPLTPCGTHSGHVVAMARNHENAWALAVVPRLLASMVGPDEFPLGAKVWDQSFVVLPPNAPHEWRNVLTGETLQVTRLRGQKAVRLRQIFRRFPVALFSAATGAKAG